MTPKEIESAAMSDAFYDVNLEKFNNIISHKIVVDLIINSPILTFFIPLSSNKIFLIQ